MMNKLSLLSVLLLFTLTLAACGGGSSGGGSGGSSGGGSSTPPVAASNFTLTPQATKTLQFSWDDVADESEYRLLENPDGVSGFTQVATIAADATSYDHVVSLPARINAQYILQSCDASDNCSDSTTVSVSTSLVAAIGYFKASNTEAGDYFGYALSLSADGDTLAVGASREDSNATGIDGNQSDNSLTDSGAVYVFTRSGTSWSQQAYLKASNTEAYDYFDYALSLSADGDTLAVGANREDSNATGIDGNQSDNSAGGSGAVYVFTRSGTSWSQQAYLKASNTEAYDEFGCALSLSADGDTLAVGAYAEDSNATGIDGNQSDNSLTDSGAVYLY